MQELSKSSILGKIVGIQSTSSRKVESGWSPQSSPLVGERQCGRAGLPGEGMTIPHVTDYCYTAWELSLLDDELLMGRACHGKLYLQPGMGQPEAQILTSHGRVTSAFGGLSLITGPSLGRVAFLGLGFNTCEMRG